jgi:hypothetical protein
MVFSVEGGPTEVKCLFFMGSSFRRRRKDVCGGLQLRGATEWMNPEHLFSSGVVSVADRAPRTDQQPAPPSGPNPVGSHPVSRGGRAPFDRGDPPSEGGEAEVPQRIGDLQDIVRTNRAGQGRFAEPPAADHPVARMQPHRRQGVGLRNQA